MYVNSGYLGNTRQDFKDKSRPLIVGSCGTYRLIRRPKLPTWRPRGRLDYQLLYIASGKAHFYLNGNDETVDAGSMVLYRPKEEQHYVYYGKDKTEVFWVHFTGGNVTNILRKYGFKDRQHVFFAGSNPEYRQIYERMISELQKCPPFFEENLTLLLNHLLILVSRQTGARAQVKEMNPYTRAAMENAVQYFDTHYSEDIRIEEFAASKAMSTSWFIRSFREYCRMTPKQYITNLRITNAKILLRQTEFPVSEIGAIVGFDNALYFSRIFRRQTGMSPSEYRRNAK